MNNRLRFRAYFENRYIYKSLTEEGYYTEDNEAIGFDNTLLNTLDWEQCTGAKDKNGKLIYEGDLFEPFEEDMYFAEVIWDDKTASFKVEYWSPSDEYNMSYGYCSSCVDELSDWLDQPIIGNINENPELLETNSEIVDE